MSAYVVNIIFVSIVCLIGAVAGIRKIKQNDEINRLVDERNERQRHVETAKAKAK
jgi:hypothetical protein